MVDRIDRLQSLLKEIDAQKISKGTQSKGDISFKELLAQSIKEVNAMKEEAEILQQKLATGQINDVSVVVNAVEKADLAFKLLMQIRNKLIDAYQEIMRMRV